MRTESFGYYGTRWRRWPGSGVVQASAVEGATPVPTPRSTVPRADEESPDTGADAADTGAGGPQRELPADTTNDAADAVRLPTAPGVDELPSVGQPRAPAGQGAEGRPTGWRALLVDGAVTPTLFALPVRRRGPPRGDAAGVRQPATMPGGQPADASADRGR